MNANKGIPVLLASSDYFFELFNKNIKLINKNAVRVLDNQMIYIKKHVALDFFHFVIEHRLVIQLDNHLKTRCQVYTVSFSDHGRQLMYQALGLIYQQGFDTGPVVSPKPLWYEDEIMAAVYLGVPGSSFLEHLKNGHFNLTHIANIATALIRMHSIDLNNQEISFPEHLFTLDKLDRTHILDRPNNLNTQLRTKVLAQLKNLGELRAGLVQEKKVFSHGDFHPENIVVNKFDSSQLSFIDFSEVCIAPRYYDIASFLLQLNLMSQGYLNPQLYLQAEDLLLKTYFQTDQLSLDIINKINLYKAWTALKNAVYSMIFFEENNRLHAEYLLGLCQKFSQSIKK